MLTSKNYIAVPPGETIKEQLKDRKKSQKEFALKMNMPREHIRKLINREVILTAETAYKLELILGGPPSFWINVEALYREKKTLVEKENSREISTVDVTLQWRIMYTKKVWLYLSSTAQSPLFFTSPIILTYSSLY